MTNGTHSRGRLSRLLVAGAATTALAVGGLAATVAPASAATAAITATPANSLAYDGQQITVDGTGYTAATVLYVAVCDTAAPPGSACDFASAAQATVAGDGTFTTPLTAKGSFGSTDCLNGVATCAVVTSNKNNPGDMTSYATTPITFAPVLKLSDNWLEVGDTVTLKGSHFPKAAAMLWVSVCGFPPSGTNCDTDLTHVGQINYDGSGSFTTKYTLKASSFPAGTSTINCAKVQCVIGTSNVNPMVQTYTSMATFNVGSAPSKAKIAKLKVKGKSNVLVKWRAAKADGAKVTGYTVQVKKAHKHWKKAGTTKPAKHKLTWKKGKVGKTYKFRVVAKSAAGNSKSKAKKITI